MNITEAPYRISGKIEKKEMGKKMDPFIAFRQVFRLSGYLMLATMMQLAVGCRSADAPRERISINDGWRFMKYGPDDKVDELIYDVRPEVRRRREIILGEDTATADAWSVSNTSISIPMVRSNPSPRPRGCECAAKEIIRDIV